MNRCCSIQDSEELDIELSLYVHMPNIDQEYINGMVRRTKDHKELKPHVLYNKIPADRVGYFKQEIEALNNRIKGWS